MNRVYIYSYDNGCIQIKEGQMITVAAFSLHRMEEYYPDPEKFDPERLIALKNEWHEMNLFHFFKNVESRE